MRWNRLIKVNMSRTTNQRNLQSDISSFNEDIVFINVKNECEE